nr:ROK family protein [Lachnospiraceae bacterium]
MGKYILGVDLGGTNIKFGLFETDGTLKCKTSISTRLGNNGDYILDDIAKEADRILSDKGIDKTEVKGIGIGVPGSVMPDGTINKCVNLGWDVVRIDDKLEK